MGTLPSAHATSQAQLAENLRVVEEMARSCHALLTYWRDDAPNDRWRAYYDAHTFLIADGLTGIAELRRDLEALVKVQAATDFHVRALEEFSRRHHAKRPLEPLVLGSGRLRRTPGRAQRLAHQIAQ